MKHINSTTAGNIKSNLPSMVGTTMNEELTILQTNKVTLGENYLTVNGDLSETELLDVFKGLMRCHNSTLFWAGDFLNAVSLSRGEKYAIAYAETDYAPSTLYNAKVVCKKFPKEKRFNLSYSHHYQALGECQGDAAKACKYLTTAAKDDLSVSEMRKHIRLSEATVQPSVEPTLVYQDIGFLNLLDAFNTIVRYLNNITSTELAIKKDYIKAEVEKLFELAKRKLN